MRENIPQDNWTMSVLPFVHTSLTSYGDGEESEKMGDASIEKRRELTG